MTAVARILIVDDEPQILSALRRLFRPSGYETVTCTSAVEALDLIQESEPFHVVISDYRMPEMSGVEFLKTVKSRSPDSVRMVISGYADTGSIIAATNEGHIYKFIPKPWDETFLLTSVADALNYHAARKKQQDLIETLIANMNKVTVPHSCEECGRRQLLQIYESLVDYMLIGLICVNSARVIVKMNNFAVNRLKLDAALMGSTLDALPSPLLSLIAARGDATSLPESVSLVLNGQEVLGLIRQISEDGTEDLKMIIILVPAVRNEAFSPAKIDRPGTRRKQEP